MNAAAVLLALQVVEAANSMSAGYLSPSSDVKFSDVPNGLAAVTKARGEGRAGGHRVHVQFLATCAARGSCSRLVPVHRLLRHLRSLAVPPGPFKQSADRACLVTAKLHMTRSIVRQFGCHHVQPADSSAERLP